MAFDSAACLIVFLCISFYFVVILLTFNLALLLLILRRVNSLFWWCNNGVGCQARGSYLTVHFKNAREVGRAIRHMPLVKAEKYLNDVIAHKQAVAFTRYNGGVGRHAQGHLVKAPGNQCRWPEAACKFFLVLLNNLKANGEAKGLNVKDLKISHVQVNHAPVMRRRTYRAHGRISRTFFIIFCVKVVFIPSLPKTPCSY